MANIGIVLSGGMAKGAYHIGVLRALLEFVDLKDIKYISASSIGVLNAYAFAAGKLDAAAELWQKTNFDEMHSFVGALLRSSFLSHAVETLACGDDMLAPSLYGTFCNLHGRSLEYINLKRRKKSDMPKYLRASVSLPGINAPVKIGKNRYYDGAFLDNIPIYPLSRHRLDYIICVYFDDYNYIFENEQLNGKTVKLAFTNDGFVRKSVFFRQDSIAYMIESGHTNARLLFSALFKNGKDDVDYILSEIARLDALSPKSTLRISADLVVNNLNKVTRRLAKKKIMD